VLHPYLHETVLVDTQLSKLRLKRWGRCSFAGGSYLARKCYTKTACIKQYHCLS